MSAPMFKELGYRKSGFRWNRSLDSGLVHAVEFVMGPRGWARPSEVDVPNDLLYGSFEVRVGVYVPEMDRLREARGWIFALSCAITASVEDLRFGYEIERQWDEVGSDPNAPALLRPPRPWQSLWDEDAAAVAKASISLYGLPWVDRLRNHDDVVRAFHDEIDLGSGRVSKTDIAYMLVNLGRRDEALELLDSE